MPKKRTDPAHSMEAITTAAMRLVKRQGAAEVTVGAVAAEAGCAKGLVHYHFKTKQILWDAVGERLSRERLESWSSVFESGEPRDAITASWGLLTRESTDGTLLAWTTMFGPGRLVSGHIASKAVVQFAASLGNRAGAMLRKLKLQVRIPEEEIGYLLGAVITGAGFQMLAGANGDDLEGAYAAAWLGIMALAE